MEIDQKGGAPFNMAMLYYFALNQLIMDKNKCRVQADLRGLYHGLEAVFVQISFRLTHEQKLEIREKLDQTKNYLYPQMSNSDTLNTQIISLSDNKAIPILNDIDIRLMDLMDRNKMIFPNVEINQGFDAVRQRMGLPNVTQT